MTYIEFFDKTMIENICASLIAPPDRIILIGDSKNTLKAQSVIYSDVFSSRGADVEILYDTVDKNSITSIVNKLTAIVEKYDDCVFDLTGGEDLLLVGAGMILERFKESKNIQMHRVNIRNGRIYDCDLDNKTICEKEAGFLNISVDENIRIYGGRIVYDDIKCGATCNWEKNVRQNTEFINSLKDDIDKIWRICRANVRKWNSQINVFMNAEKLRGTGESGTAFTIETNALYEKLQNAEYFNTYVKNSSIIKALNDAHLIQTEINDDIFSVEYKNEHVRSCLIKAGQALEMKIYTLALNMRERNGGYFYNDVMTGVCIDWDGEIHTELGNCDIGNEIDVIMTRGMTPVFVSCKNGHVDVSELYKFSAVAERFGGKYAHKVLIATSLSAEGAENIRERAREMKIRLAEGIIDSKSGALVKHITEMSDKEIEDMLKSLS